MSMHRCMTCGVVADDSEDEIEVIEGRPIAACARCGAHHRGRRQLV